MPFSTKSFRHKNIQQKLLSIIFLTIFFSLVPVLIAMFTFEYISSKHTVTQEIRVQADIISNNVAPALAFIDKEAAQESLATLAAAPAIEKAVVYLPSQEPFASYFINGSTSDAFPFYDLEVDSESISWTRFIVKKSVYLGDVPVGILVLEANLDSFFDKIIIFSITILVAALVAFSLSFAIGLKLKTSISSPLGELMESVDKVSNSYDFSIKPNITSSDEIGDLSKAFTSLLSALKARDERLHEMAFYDTLTKLPNRHFFKNKILDSVDQSLNYKKRLALIFIDLDNFKVINDTLGHHIGDELLKVIGNRIQSVLREGDFVSRLGGDEFAVILENIKTEAIAEKVAEKIINTVSQPVTIESVKQKLKIGASIGISFCPEHATDAPSLLKASDMAMYVAKERTKNAYHIYSKEIQGGKQSDSH